MWVEYADVARVNDEVYVWTHQQRGIHYQIPFTMVHNIIRQSFRIIFEGFKIPTNMSSDDNNDIMSSKFKMNKPDRPRTTKKKRELFII